MDATTFLIILLILVIAERRSSQSLALVRLSLELLRERQRSADALAQLEAMRQTAVDLDRALREGASAQIAALPHWRTPATDEIPGLVSRLIGDGRDDGRAGR